MSMGIVLEYLSTGSNSWGFVVIVMDLQVKYRR